MQKTVFAIIVFMISLVFLHYYREGFELLKIPYAMFLSTEESIITSIACWIIMVFAFLFSGIIESSKGNREDQIAFATMASTILPTVGILGTFFGIFYGLLDFNFNNEESFSDLLEGLKVAFGSSVLGLGGALLFRLWRDLEEINDEEEEITAKHLQEELQAINAAIIGGNEEEDSLLGGLYKVREELHNGFGGQQETLRQGFTEQKEAFEKFADKVVSASVEQIINALKEVIEKFDGKIQDRLAESFDKLNEALQSLLKWQEGHKQQLQDINVALKNFVETLEEVENKSIQAIQEAERSLQNIKESVEKISGSADMIGEIVETMHDETKVLYGSLSEFSQIGEEARKALPIIQKYWTEIAANFDTKWREINETIRKTKSLVDEQNKVTAASIKNLKERITAMDAAMQKEVDGVLQRMGENLLGITKQFEEVHKDFSGKVVDVARIIDTASRQNERGEPPESLRVSDE